MRSSLAAARFKADAPDLAALASELDVNVAVTGTLLRAGAEVRVATQLIEVQTGRLLWSKTTQVTLNDIFQLQDDLTRQIVESLSLPLSAREQRMLSHDTPATARAYEYYLRANELASDPKSWGIARDLYQQSIDEDPRYAPAWARLGSLLRRLAKLGGGTDEDMVRAEAAVGRALELNPDMPLAHSLAALIHIDRGRARDAMVRLTELATRRSTDPELFAGLVYACRFCGLLGASLRADLRARRLDPSIRTSAIHTLFMLGQHDAVVASPVESPAVVAFSLVALGREQDALVLIAEKDKSVPPRIRGALRVTRMLLEGRPEDAVEEIHAIAPDFRDAEGLYYLARQLAYAGAADDAMRLLERATGAGFWCYPLLASDAWLDPLRDRPDFAVVLDRAKQELDLASAAFTSAGGDQILGSDYRASEVINVQDELEQQRREELEELRRLEYRQSRIPALNALEVFVPDDSGPDPVVDEMRTGTGFSRWQPVDGGHQVLILHEGGSFDPERFSLRKGAWDHEHCKRCVSRIEALTLCWVSTSEDFTILCDECHRLVIGPPRIE